MKEEESIQQVALETLLRPPDEPHKLPYHWRMISTRDHLFEALKQAVNHGALGQATQWIDEWRDWPRGDAPRAEWEIATALVWCAEQAAKAPASIKASPSAEAIDEYRKSVELERCCFAIRSKDYVSESLQDWAWGCIRTFLNAPTRGRVLHIPAAAWRPVEKTALLLTLQLELLEGGTGGMFHHPRDAFATRVDEGFNDSMREAWQAACTLTKEDGVAPRCDGRWRFLSEWTWEKAKRAGLTPAELASERSASGAAARGWWFALSNKVPDEEIVVLAQSDAAGALSPVTGITAKVRAIAEVGGFDTIAVTTENVCEAQEAIRDWGKLGTVEVVDIAHPADRRSLPSARGV